MGAPATAVSAQAEDASRTEGEAILVGAGTASLVAVGFTLVDAGRSTGAARISLIARAVVSVVLAWASVHGLRLRYARLYYAEPSRHRQRRRRAELPRLRHVALGRHDEPGLRHEPRSRACGGRQSTTLLSYLFAAVVVALMINIVASLLRA
jgi:uncharacterized membrane protein